MKYRPILISILFVYCMATGAFSQVTVELADTTQGEQALLELENISAQFAEAEDAEALSALYLRRAQILLELDEMELARSDAYTALDRSTTRELRNDAWQLLTQISFARGFYFETLRRLTDTERLRPLDLNEKAMLSTALVGSGMTASGDAIFHRIKDSLPLDWTFWQSAIKAKRVLRQADSALELLHRFMEATGRQSNSELLFLEAVIEFEAGNYDQAIKIANDSMGEPSTLSKERKEFIQSWIELVENPAGSSSNEQPLLGQIANIAPLTDFESLPAEEITESSGVIRSEAIYYGTQIVALYLPPGETIQFTQKDQAILRVSARLVEKESLFYEGSAAAHLFVKAGKEQYKFPVPRMTKSLRNPVSGFQETYFSPPASYFLPLEDTESKVTIRATGSPISVEIALAKPILSDYMALPSGFEDMTQPENSNDIDTVNLFNNLRQAAIALKPGWKFNPRLAIYLLEQIEKARPNLAWLDQAKRSVHRLMQWQRIGTILHSHGYETIEVTGSSYDPFLQLRDDLAPCNFQKESYVLFSADSPLRLVAQGDFEKSFDLSLQAINPYRMGESRIESAGTIEVLIDDELVSTHQILFGQILPLSLPPVERGEKTIRLRLRHAYSGTLVRAQCTNAATGQLLSPKLQSRMWVASTQNPIQVALSGPVSVRLKTSWLQLKGNVRAKGVRIRIRDMVGNPVYDTVFELPAESDPVSFVSGFENQKGKEIRLDLSVDSKKRFLLEMEPFPASYGSYVAVVPYLYDQTGTYVRSYSIKPITPDDIVTPEPLEADRFNQNENRIHWHSGGSFSFEGGYGRDDFDYADVSDQKCCEGCGREYVDGVAAHRLYIRKAWLHHRFEAGGRNLFTRPTVIRGRERLIWRPPLGSLRIIGDERIYTQQIDANRAWTNYFSGQLEYPIGSDLFLFTPSAGAFYKWTNVKEPTDTEKEKMEAYVYSTHLEDHLTGADLELSLSSRPFQGIRIHGGTAATSNSDFTFGPADRLRPNAGFNFYGAGFILSPRYQYSLYFKDEDRAEDFGRSEWSASGEYGFWTPWGDRISFAGKASYMSDSKTAGYYIGLRYEWLRGRGLFDYDSTEEVFLEQMESNAPQHGVLERGRH